MYGLTDYHLRRQLHDEVHARPPTALATPARIIYIAMLSPRSAGEGEQRHLEKLTMQFGVAGPEKPTNHFSANLGQLQLKWERHAEFARYKLILPDKDPEPFETSALDSIPKEWLAGIPGEVIAASDVALVPGPAPDDANAISDRYFSGNMLVSSLISDAKACAFADFRIRADGMSRFLIYDLGLRPRQAGRLVQRLLEIDTYRMMALLALPGAMALRPFLDRSERELAELTAGMADGTASDDPNLLDRLTRLEGEIQSRQADNHYRLSAAQAYYEIVQRRIGELREERVGGLQTLQEFMERRLVPAMSTCRSVWVSADQLSERISRCTALLSTRVGIARETQSRKLLQQMARRAKLQLRLQQTVEGLSLAAISYYIVGLVGYASKALQAAGLGVSPDLIVGFSVPVVLLTVAFGLSRIRQWLRLNQRDRVDAD